MIDLDMAFISNKRQSLRLVQTAAKVQGSSAYSCPEMFAASKDGKAVDLNALVASQLATPDQLDCWSFAVTLFEMVTGSALLPNVYDVLTKKGRKRLSKWTGLSGEDIARLEEAHGKKEVTPLVDLLSWALGSDAKSRPTKMKELLEHAFFDSTKGAMREHFVVDRVRELIADRRSGARPCYRIMVSYCWTDTVFVLSKLCIELATIVDNLWLDRLGGDQGMGEWTGASMEAGVRGADAIVAVVSPDYIKSKNCGFEMELAAKLGKTVIPIMYVIAPCGYNI